MDLLNNRIILSNNGTLTDVTDRLNNSNSKSEVIPNSSSQDAILIGSTLPFNHRYIFMNVANDQASALSVSVWDGSAWVACVNVLDQTRSDDRTIALARSGSLSFELPKGENWQREDCEDMSGSGLETLKIYDLYWAKINYSADLNALTEIKFIGHKFAEDEDLGAFYPDINTSDARTQFNNGVATKTSWDEQHIQAAEIIIRDIQKLKSAEKRVDYNQVIRFDLLREAAIHKVAEIIFNSHGDDGNDDRERARAYYEEAISLASYQLDLNRNTRLDENESVPVSTVIRR